MAGGYEDGLRSFCYCQCGHERRLHATSGPGGGIVGHCQAGCTDGHNFSAAVSPPIPQNTTFESEQ